MQKYSAYNAPEQHTYQSQPSNPASNRVMPQPGNPSPPMQQPYPNTLPPIQRDQTNMGVMLQPVNQSQPPQQPQYPQKPIHGVQPNSARMAWLPSDYLGWSITNTVCSVMFSLWA
jgi:hypothetical protein